MIRFVILLFKLWFVTCSMLLQKLSIVELWSESWIWSSSLSALSSTSSSLYLSHSSRSKWQFVEINMFVKPVQCTVCTCSVQRTVCTWIVLWLCWCHSAMQVSQCAIKFARAGNTAGYIICCCQRICPQGFDCSSLSDESCVVTLSQKRQIIWNLQKLPRCRSNRIWSPGSPGQRLLELVSFIHCMYIYLYIQGGFYCLTAHPPPSPWPLKSQIT